MLNGWFRFLSSPLADGEVVMSSIVAAHEANVAYSCQRGITLHFLLAEIFSQLEIRVLRAQNTRKISRVLQQLGREHENVAVRRFFAEYPEHTEWLAGCCKYLCKVFEDWGVQDLRSEQQLPTFLLPSGYELRCGKPDFQFDYQNRAYAGVAMLELKSGIRPMRKDRLKMMRYLAGTWVQLHEQGRAHELNAVVWLSLSTYAIDLHGRWVLPTTEQPYMRFHREPFCVERLDASFLAKFGVRLQDLPDLRIS